ncbi:MAG: DUF2461 domain-containing protein, partial [Muribaculaceae bacterium]|nr:DUF2461 domain-containing protein [Muribaculaceae bacterium]
MKQIFDFLKELAANNNRDWFNAHKDEYLKVKASVEELTERLIAGIAQFDSGAAALRPSQCLYR